MHRDPFEEMDEIMNSFFRGGFFGPHARQPGDFGRSDDVHSNEEKRDWHRNDLGDPFGFFRDANRFFQMMDMERFDDSGHLPSLETPHSNMSIAPIDPTQETPYSEVQDPPPRYRREEPETGIWNTIKRTWTQSKLKEKIDSLKTRLPTNGDINPHVTQSRTPVDDPSIRGFGLRPRSPYLPNSAGAEAEAPPRQRSMFQSYSVRTTYGSDGKGQTWTTVTGPDGKTTTTHKSWDDNGRPIERIEENDELSGFDGQMGLGDIFGRMLGDMFGQHRSPLPTITLETPHLRDANRNSILSDEYLANESKD